MHIVLVLVTTIKEWSLLKSSDHTTVTSTTWCQFADCGTGVCRAFGNWQVVICSLPTTGFILYHLNQSKATRGTTDILGQVD